MTYLELDGDEVRQVEVQMDDGLWVPGSLEAYRKVEGVWSGFVRYSLAAGATQSGWFEEGRVRATSTEPPTRDAERLVDGAVASPADLTLREGP